MTSPSFLPEQTSLLIRWPVTYGNDHFLSQGTLLRISHTGWRVVGTMPVNEDMRLNMWVSPPQKLAQIYIQDVRVLWVNGLEFGIECATLRSTDRLWLLGYMENAHDQERFAAQHFAVQSERNPPLNANRG
ncbi:MAG TPA: hypothetical protein VIU63_08835 [Nitrospira sp.]